MDAKKFLHSVKLIKTELIDKNVSHTFNSIGSNIFIEFGKEKKVVAKNGKERIVREWSIWIGDASWRLTKNGKYIVGSNDISDEIQQNLQNLLEKKLTSFKFTSSFLELELNFSEDYKIVTFFNWFEENQWSLFFPDQSNITIDFSSIDQVKSLRNISRDLQNHHSKEKNNSFFLGERITNISFDEQFRPYFFLQNNVEIKIIHCMWRLEKKGEYLIGSQDEVEKKMLILPQLINEVIQGISIMNIFMDSRFEFENGYVFKTFTCSHEMPQWELLRQGVGVPLS